ncbi:MAG: membrane protein [Nitrospira sp.]
MFLRAAPAAILVLVILGCASTEQAGDTPQVTFQQVKASPDAFKGQSVVFGGEVLTARRMKDGTRVEILQLPLGSSGSPVHDLTQSQGRFVAIQKEFLDPATLPYGTRVTVTGEMTGSITLPLDETEYNYPLVEAKRLQVWSDAARPVPRFRPYYGPGPYSSPYWNPYW